MVRGNTITIEGNRGTDAVDTQLAYLNHGWSYGRTSSNENLSLDLKLVVITPRVLSLLVKLLNQPIRRKNVPNEKWYRVFLDCCRFEKDPTNRSPDTNNEPNVCTSEMMYTLFSTLMNRAHSLKLRESDSSNILLCLTTNPLLDQIKTKSLRIADETIWHADVYARFGDLIERSTHLRKLNLSLRFDQAPSEMLESLANAIRIHRIRLAQSHVLDEQDREQVLFKLVGGGDHNGVVVRLLQNPQSQLQHLELSNMRLDDDNFIPIVQLLPTSQLKILDVSRNRIQSRGVFEFARQLSRIQSLKKVAMGDNLWLRSAQADECGLALLRGLRENYSVEEFGSGMNGNLLLLQDFVVPQAFLLMHYLDINRAGRRLLVVSSNIPLGLWPHILERAGTKLSYVGSRYDPFLGQGRRRANAVFFLLRNSPIVCHAATNSFLQQK